MLLSLGVNHMGIICLNMNIDSGSLRKGLRFAFKKTHTQNREQTNKQKSFHWPWPVETLLGKKRKHEVLGLSFSWTEVIMTESKTE